MSEIRPEKYLPNDSPFGDCYAGWLEDADFERATANDLLQAYSLETLDEFAQLARYQRTVPVYEADEDLKAFAEALQAAYDFQLEQRFPRGEALERLAPVPAARVAVPKCVTATGGLGDEGCWCGVCSEDEDDGEKEEATCYGDEVAIREATEEDAAEFKADREGIASDLEAHLMSSVTEFLRARGIEPDEDAGCPGVYRIGSASIEVTLTADVSEVL